jgi:type IX secretion system PorP/SprF family membrane protein
MSYKLSIAIPFAFICTITLGQQLTAVSQFDQNMMYYNPAATGQFEALTANFLFRSHWTGFEGAPTTQLFNVHAPLKNPAVAIGLSLQHQSIGSLNYTGIFFNYAYSLNLGKSKVTFGIKGGINSGSQDIPYLSDDAPDRAFTELNRTFIIPDFGVGSMYRSERFWASLSVPSLFGITTNGSGKYAITADSVNRDLVIAGGAVFQIDTEFKIEPSVICIANPGKPFTFAFQAVGSYQNTFRFGLGYRSSKAMVIIAGYNLNRQFALGYSFDLNLGELSNFGTTSHEISLRYRFGYKVNASNPRGF